LPKLVVTMAPDFGVEQQGECQKISSGRADETAQAASFLIG
jgi:hypothetical protein